MRGWNQSRRGALRPMLMAKFKDHFSGHAADYAKYRPHYPRALFGYLASLAPDRQMAWDCATGSGQAACATGEFFEHVIATDASEKQLASAMRHPRVAYRVALAEASGLEGNSVALITVAQALHWFDCERFFAEANRVLHSRGVLAVWSYNLFWVAPEIDELVGRFYRETVGPFWDFERRLVENGYETVEFPFTKIPAPDFQMSADWTIEQALGYLRTWSATKAFIAQRGFDPVDSLGEKLNPVWKEPRRIAWPLSLIVRRKD